MLTDNPDMVAAAVLSGVFFHVLQAVIHVGNRNFEGRVHPLTRANYLASPPLVVAYALAGSLTFNFDTDPLGTEPLFLLLYPIC